MTAGFSFDSKSAVPNSYFGAGTPSFQENLTKLCSGTPTLLKKSPWDSCFENPSENPELLHFFSYICLSTLKINFKKNTRIRLESLSVQMLLVSETYGVDLWKGWWTAAVCKETSGFYQPCFPNLLLLSTL